MTRALHPGPGEGPLRPLRSQDRPAGEELAAWELMRSVDPEVALSELSAARILSRVHAEARQPQRRSSRWLVAAAAAAFSLLGLQVAMAAMVVGIPALRHGMRAEVVRRLVHPVVAAREPPKAEAPPPPVATAVAMFAPKVIPPAPLEASREAGTHHGPIVRPKALQADAAPASSRPEVEVMSMAARELYADHDPLSALATLEPYLYLHPGGSLRPDMIVAAVQADLELDRTPEALGLLDGMAAQNFGGLPRAAELRLLRGELLARSHRCREALPVFEEALAASEGLQRERALYGRGVCLAELRDFGGSRADLRAYLEQYPAGRFAAEAERALDQTP